MAREPKIISDWIKQGHKGGDLSTRRRCILIALQHRFKAAVPEPTRLAIEGTSDPVKLHKWHPAALDAADLADFCRRARLDG